jgi:signal transduction histidine kinase/DNA-binding response OmpR family regulator
MIWSLIIVSILAFTLLVLFLLERSRRKKAFAENMDSKEELEKIRSSMNEQERFLAYTSHELRTPLNAISGGTQLLSKTALDEKQKKYLNTIQASVDSSLLIVNDILDLAKLDSNMVEVRPVDFLISEVIKGITYIIGFRAEQKGLVFTTEFDERIPPVIRGDSKHLNQILLNLLTNAVKFTDLGKVTLRVEMLEENDGQFLLRFDVADTGKGIRKSSLSTIFNQYEQETRHTIKHTGGTGLGLAITKKLVELQNGTINVDSKYLEGTTFTVIIPFKKAKGTIVTQKDQDANLFQKLNGVKILAVDDNLINREILYDLLKDANPYMEIDMAEDGEDAIQKILQKSYDLILLDLQMPKKNGYETSEHIRKNMRYPVCDTPIIAMTAHALENVAESCFKAGMNDYISKPIDLTFLGNKMVKLIEKKRKVNERLSRFKTIDLEHLQELTKDNKDRILKYITIFLSNLPDELDILKKHAELRDYKSIKESLHKIKGIVAYMGIKSLTRLFSSMEYINLEELTDENLKKFFNEIEETCYKAIDELKIVQQEL